MKGLAPRRSKHDVACNWAMVYVPVMDDRGYFSILYLYSNIVFFQ